jgi:cation diffusion facilitator CzcD-associated flavoprotein CzcO
MEKCARKYDLMRHIQFNTEIASANWDEDACLWRIRTSEGEELEALVLVSSVGQLNRPHLPKIDGAENFKGPAFHSARWRHDIDFNDFNFHFLHSFTATSHNSQQR